MPDLIVTRAFGTYSIGDRVTDADTVAKIQAAAEGRRNTVRGAPLPAAAQATATPAARATATPAAQATATPASKDA